MGQQGHTQYTLVVTAIMLAISIILGLAFTVLAIFALRKDHKDGASLKPLTLFIILLAVNYSGEIICLILSLNGYEAHILRVVVSIAWESSMVLFMYTLLQRQLLNLLRDGATCFYIAMKIILICIGCLILVEIATEIVENIMGLPHLADLPYVAIESIQYLCYAVLFVSLTRGFIAHLPKHYKKHRLYYIVLPAYAILLSILYILRDICRVIITNRYEMTMIEDIVDVLSDGLAVIALLHFGKSLVVNTKSISTYLESWKQENNDINPATGAIIYL